MGTVIMFQPSTARETSCIAGVCCWSRSKPWIRSFRLMEHHSHSLFHDVASSMYTVCIQSIYTSSVSDRQSIYPKMYDYTLLSWLFTRTVAVDRVRYRDFMAGAFGSSYLTSFRQPNRLRSYSATIRP